MVKTVVVDPIRERFWDTSRHLWILFYVTSEPPISEARFFQKTLSTCGGKVAGTNQVPPINPGSAAQFRLEALVQLGFRLLPTLLLVRFLSHPRNSRFTVCTVKSRLPLDATHAVGAGGGRIYIYIYICIYNIYNIIYTYT